MLYSPETIFAVYTMSEKVLKLCSEFVLSLNADCYQKGTDQQNEFGIGYYFSEKAGQQREFFVGISPAVPNEYSFSVALKLNNNRGNLNAKWYTDEQWAYFPLDKEILALDISEQELQRRFNDNVNKVIETICSTAQ